MRKPLKNKQTPKEKILLKYREQSTLKIKYTLYFNIYASLVIKSRSIRFYNYHKFKVLIRIKNILRYLKPLKHNIKILITSMGEKVTSPANITVVYCLHANIKGMLNFHYRLMKIKIYFFLSNFLDLLNLGPTSGHLL